MRLAASLVLLAACAPTLSLTRTAPPALRDDTVIAIASSGPYATELVAHLRAKLAGRATVEACVVGCPAVGLYASVSLTPGAHEGRVLRTCQAEVYAGPSWVKPEAVRLRLVAPVDGLDDCVRAIASGLLEPRRFSVRARLDDRGPLAPAVLALRDGRPDEARAMLEALPPSAGARYDLALIHEAQGRPDEARRCAAEAKQLGAEPWMIDALDATD